MPDPREATKETNQIQQLFEYHVQDTLLSCQKYKVRQALSFRSMQSNKNTDNN